MNGTRWLAEFPLATLNVLSYLVVKKGLHYPQLLKGSFLHTIYEKYGICISTFVLQLNSLIRCYV